MKVLILIAAAGLLAGCGGQYQASKPAAGAVNHGPVAWSTCLIVCNQQVTIEDQYGNTGGVQGGDISNSQTASLPLGE